MSANRKTLELLMRIWTHRKERNKHRPLIKAIYKPLLQRRWFHDPDNKLLGGKAGLAAYFGWDITLVRILMIILVFVPCCPMIILYIIGWIVIPEARTAAEKLSMRGSSDHWEYWQNSDRRFSNDVADGVNNYMNSGKPRTFLQKIERCICFHCCCSL